MKLFEGVEGELTVIQVIHSEFDVETVKLIVTWRTGLEKGVHMLALLVIFFVYMRKIMFSLKGMKHYIIFVGCYNGINLVLAMLFSHS